MARKRHSDEDILRILREIEVHLASRNDVPGACCAAGISDATYYKWRKKCGGWPMENPHLKARDRDKAKQWVEICRKIVGLV